MKHVLLPNVCPYCAKNDRKRIHIVIWERTEDCVDVYKCPTCGKESFRG